MKQIGKTFFLEIWKVTILNKLLNPIVTVLYKTTYGNDNNVMLTVEGAVLSFVGSGTSATNTASTLSGLGGGMGNLSAGGIQGLGSGLSGGLGGGLGGGLSGMSGLSGKPDLLIDID